MKSPPGLITSIERFAVHDGPGIRTLIFMKGCPLRCLWCSSPQTQNTFTEILHNTIRCRKCGACVGACPAEAIAVAEDGGFRLQRKNCTGCGECVTACPNQALELSGSHVTVEQLMKGVGRDTAFYRRSNGGITVGGGEPTMQHEFVTEFLRRLKKLYLHTAIETCGYAQWPVLEKILEYVDLIHFDIKHMDSRRHCELTGVSNELILENVRRASILRNVIIRVPVVPGYNDSDDNVQRIGHFAAGLGRNLQGIELLPYHEFGAQTYAELSRKYELNGLKPPSADHMDELKQIVESCRVTALIGG